MKRKEKKFFNNEVNRAKSNKIKQSILYIAIGLALSQSTLVQAAIMVDINQGKIPLIKANSNGSLTVNINASSPNGISHNKFTEFDVTHQGVTLNNSAQASNTTVSGKISGNKNMANGSASLIINEVTANRASQLNGMIEVAGKKADVIIANPAGISCDGCGFINTGRSTLTTGKPVINNDNLTGIKVDYGTITITGNGMNDSSDYTGLLAKTVKIDAALKAKDLQIMSGANSNVTVVDNQLVNTGNNVSDNTPSFGVDVSSLGGMYANKITLVAAGNGVGVRNNGLIAADTNLNININGTLTNPGSMKSNTGDTQLIAGSIDNSKGLISSTSGDITAIVDRDIINSLGGIATNGSVNINAINVNNDSGLIYGNDISIVTEKLNNTDSSKYVLQHQNNSAVTGLNNKNGLYAKSDININANSTILSDAGNIKSEGGTVSLTSNRNVSIDNSIVSGKNIYIYGDRIGNYTIRSGLVNTKIYADNDFILNVGHIGDFSSETLISTGHDIVFNRIGNQDLYRFANYGTVAAGNDFNINHGANIYNYGVLHANKNFFMKASTIENHGVINSGESITLRANTFLNIKGALMTSNKPMTLQARDFTNKGNIISMAGINVASDSFTNQGSIFGQLTQTPYQQ